MELRLAFVLALVSAACRPEIGDPCEVSTDCSPTGERLCDITQKPGGYCTVFNCEPDECPEEAVCVRFGDRISTVEGCEDPLGQGPYARTYCLKKCGENNDCRENDGYKCLDPRRAWGAAVLDPLSKVCGIPPKGNPLPKLDDEDEDPTRSNDVCTGDITPPAGGTGGMPSDGGMGGAPSDGGMGGAGG